MYPQPVSVFGRAVEVWDLTFLVAVATGYPVLSRSLRATMPASRPRWLPLRWLALVYLAALSAQVFAYLVDAHAALRPPSSISPLRYYLDPFFRPKTLYGVILFLPVTAAVLCPPWRPAHYARALDAVTPALFAVLAICRIGCFLQGCCYGLPSRAFGVSFPPGSPASARQLGEGLILAGSWTLPVVPTQLIETGGLGGLAVWTQRRLGGGGTVFGVGVAAYSAFRFVLEFARDDPERNFLGPLSASQWVALALLAALALWRRRVPG
jgi:hypothetical protein